LITKGYPEAPTKIVLIVLVLEDKAEDTDEAA
jgi:hypothetical protein